ncbi:MAG: hypothetical protein ACJ8ER_05090 [Allosphingosinicella sp.]
MSLRPAPLALLALLAACAAPGPYPSLAPRPAEKAYAEGDEERQPTAQPDDPALAGEIDRLTAEARAGGGAFDSALGPAQAAVAAAGPSGSDSWVEAQEKISRVEAARARTTAALADLDAFAVERAKAGTLSPGDDARLHSALAEIQALADAQAAHLRRLEESLTRS